MHRALQIHEILLNIFGHCAPPESHWTPSRRTYTTDLAALARTCHTFEEPALDVLWSEQVDLTPLARCLPEVCHFSAGTYSFQRPLEEEEWDILLSYTRRVWNVYGNPPNPQEWLDKDNLIAICNAGNPIRPLFPNIRKFFWLARPLIPAVHIAVPSLTMLDLNVTYLENESALIDFLTSVGDYCRGLTQVRLHTFQSEILRGSICRQIYRWQRLQLLDFHGLAVTPDTISQLSNLPCLRSLTFTLIPDVTDWTPASGSLSIFSTLRCLAITSESLHSVAGFFSCTRLPVLESLLVICPRRPTGDAFRSYLSTVRNACSPDQLTGFTFFNHLSPRLRVNDATGNDRDHQLTLDDFRSLTEFVNLRRVRVDFKWFVNLTDEDMLALVSTWPRLQRLRINESHGWRAPRGGITLRGLVKLAQERPSLEVLSVALRTESYVTLPESDELADGVAIGTVPYPLQVHVSDSPVRAQDVPALVDTFVRLRGHFRFTSDSSWCRVGMMNERLIAHGWRARVWRLVLDGVAERLSESGVA